VTWRIDERILTAWRRVDEDLTALPGPLGSLWHQYATTLAHRAAVEDLSKALQRPEAFPSLPLLWWTASLVGFEDEQALDELSYGTLMGYLFIRIQDDVLDGHTKSENLLVANAAQERFQEVFRRHFGTKHRFWDIWLSWLVDFSAATAWEIQEHRNRRQTFTTPDLDRLGEKFLPAAAPPAALAFTAGRDELVRPIRELVTTLGSGLQLINDHRGIRHDFETNNYTAVITDILVTVPKIRLAEELAFPNRALTTDAMERNLRRARIYLERAADLGRAMGMSQVAAYVQEHQEAILVELERLKNMRSELIENSPAIRAQGRS